MKLLLVALLIVCAIDQYACQLESSGKSYTVFTRFNEAGLSIIRVSHFVKLLQKTLQLSDFTNTVLLLN